jgi:NTP pyrophosphatase (non-canonical NTP hydrolase)
MSDAENTIKELQDKVIAFRAARKWSRNPKDLAITISVEANELLELFQFDKYLETDVNEDTKKELADIMISCLEFASERGIDITDAVEQKLKKLEVKFPVEVFKDGGASEEYHKIRKEYRKDKS